MAPLAKNLDLAIPQLETITKELREEGVLTVQGALFPASATLTAEGLSKAAEVTDSPRPLRRSKILFIDTEPEVVQRVKAAGYETFDVSIGYRTGKRNFAYPAPNEVDLIISDLRRPACFDRQDWGPQGSNNNFECKILPQEKVNNKFYVRNGRRHAVHRMIYESQLGPQIPGTFGAKEVTRAIVEARVPFLLFLNPEWLFRTETFPSWLEAKWSFAPTTATHVRIAEPLARVLPELGQEIKFKLAITNLIEKGPHFSQPQPRYKTSQTTVVTNNIGDCFGQLVQMGAGSVWLLPPTHQNVDFIELFASRLAVVSKIDDLVQNLAGPSPAASLAKPSASAVTSTDRTGVQIMKERAQEKSKTDPRSVFVIHGRDERLRSGMFQFLRSIDLNPIEWSRAVELTSKASPYVGEVLDAAFSHAQAVVVLLTPDDVTRLRPDLCGDAEPVHETEPSYQARPNVLFESGMAMARDPDRTVLVEVGRLRPFSDIGGRHTIRMDNSLGKRQELAQRLKHAGCAVNMSGTDWHTAGDLKPPDLATQHPVQNERKVGNESDTNQLSIPDLISELEDNLERARSPRVGDAFARPTSEVWRNVRNRVKIPDPLRGDVTNIYREIESWRTVVDSGVHPNMGSPALQNIANSLRTRLPAVIEALKQL